MYVHINMYKLDFEHTHGCVTTQTNALLIVKWAVDRQMHCDRVTVNKDTFCRVIYSGGTWCTRVPYSSVTLADTIPT